MGQREVQIDLVNATNSQIVVGKRLPKVATEMASHVLAYNLTRVMNIIGVKPLLAAI